MHLEERWRTTIRGHMVRSILSDGPSDSLMVGDGWGISFSSLRLHRMDLGSGALLAEVRTRHQPVSALLRLGDHVYAGTDTRLFEMDPVDLSVVRQWDRGLVRFSKALAAAGDKIVAANWLAPTVGVFDRHTGRTRRLRVGRQPLIVEHEGEVKIVAGFDGGMWTLDVDRCRLTDMVPLPPVSRACSGRDIWAVLAGPVRGAAEGSPSRGDTNALVRIAGDRWQVELDEICIAIACDEAANVVWCVLGTGDRLQAISQRSGRVVHEIRVEPWARFAHVDPVTRVAMTTEDRHPDDARPGDAAADLICYDLPLLQG